MPAQPRLTPAQLRQKLHDGLCQQLAGSVLLQAALINRLQKAASAQDELLSVVADARKVEELLRLALEETRTLMQEIG